MRLFRILRGIIGTAVTWSAAWVTLSVLPLAVAGLFGVAMPSRGLLAMMLLNRLLSGALNGLAFASIVAIAGRRTTFAQLRLPWIAICGALGGIALPLVVQLVFGVGIPLRFLAYALGTDALFGATLATVSLSVARRAPDAPRLDRPAGAALDAGTA